MQSQISLHNKICFLFENHNLRLLHLFLNCSHAHWTSWLEDKHNLIVKINKKQRWEVEFSNPDTPLSTPQPWIKRNRQGGNICCWCLWQRMHKLQDSFSQDLDLIVPSCHDLWNKEDVKCREEVASKFGYLMKNWWKQNVLKKKLQEPNNSGVNWGSNKI